MLKYNRIGITLELRITPTAKLRLLLMTGKQNKDYKKKENDGVPEEGGEGSALVSDGGGRGEVKVEMEAGVVEKEGFAYEKGPGYHHLILATCSEIKVWHRSGFE